MAADPNPQLPPRWGEVLARVEKSLATAVEAADRRDQAMRELTAAGAPGVASGLTEGLARFGERLRGLTECVARAERAVNQADADLVAGEDALREWFQTAEAVRRKLAGWGGKA